MNVLSRKTSVCVAVCLGVCATTFLLCTKNVIQFQQPHQAGLPERSSKKTPFSVQEATVPEDTREDLPVRFMSELSQEELDNISSPRKYELGHVMKSMLNKRLHDDYRFCRKEAKFVGPFNYIRYLNNPCWHTESGQLVCVPYFYLVGFSKCGTSDLFSRIIQHHQIFGYGKEKHWFDYVRFYKGNDSIETYTDMLNASTKEIKKSQRNATHSLRKYVIGDGTPCTVWFSLFWPCYEGNRGLTQPRFTNADVIYRLNPRSKIIIILRDPVKRLYSRYLMWIGRLREKSYIEATPTSFHQLCEKAVDLYKSCFNSWSHRHCAYNGTLYTLAKLRLQEGMYSVFIRDWLKVFPKNQIMFIKFEDYIRKIPPVLKNIYSFLGVDELPEEGLERIANNKIRNKGQNYDVGPMLNKTVALLRRFYSPFNEELPWLLRDYDAETSWLWGYE